MNRRVNNFWGNYKGKSVSRILIIGARKDCGNGVPETEIIKVLFPIGELYLSSLSNHKKQMDFYN